MGIHAWGHRFVLAGYVVAAIGGWMLVRKPSKAGSLFFQFEPPSK
jgi:hypothetical protein